MRYFGLYQNWHHIARSEFFTGILFVNYIARQTCWKLQRFSTNECDCTHLNICRGSFSRKEQKSKYPNRFQIHSNLIKFEWMEEFFGYQIKKSCSNARGVAHLKDSVVEIRLPLLFILYYRLINSICCRQKNLHLNVVEQIDNFCPFPLGHTSF